MTSKHEKKKSLTSLKAYNTYENNITVNYLVAQNKKNVIYYVGWDTGTYAHSSQFWQTYKLE